MSLPSHPPAEAPSEHPVAGRAARWRRWAGGLVAAAGLAFLAVFGVRAWQQYQFAQLVASGQIQVQTLRGWMTLPYVAQRYGVSEARLRSALGAPPTGHEDRSLRAWVSVLGLEPLAARQRLEAVILAEGQVPRGEPAP